jgi:hypothetical protein
MKVHTTPTNGLGGERHRKGVARPEENFASTAAKRVTAKTAATSRKSALTVAKRVTAETVVVHRCVLTDARRIAAKTAVGHRCVFTAA